MLVKHNKNSILRGHIYTLFPSEYPRKVTPNSKEYPEPAKSWILTDL